MSDMTEFLDDIINDKLADATEKFNDVMAAKVADVVSTKREEISKTMFRTPEVDTKE